MLSGNGVFKNGAGSIEHPSGKHKSWLLFHTIYKINWRWIVDKNDKSKKNLLQDIIVEYLNDIKVEIIYLNRAQFMSRIYNFYESGKKERRRVSLDRSLTWYFIKRYINL
jgi:hypothetical protein